MGAIAAGIVSVTLLAFVAIVYYVFLVPMVDSVKRSKEEAQRQRDAEKEKLQRLKAYACCEYELYRGFCTLDLKRRSSRLKDAFEIEALKDVNVSYTPDKLVYTGATVGGITTGGFHVEKGGYSLSSGAFNGMYSLNYKFGEDYDGNIMKTSVLSIKMNDDDYKYAKEHFDCLHAEKYKTNVFRVNGSRASLQELVNWMCMDS